MAPSTSRWHEGSAGGIQLLDVVPALLSEGLKTALSKTVLLNSTGSGRWRPARSNNNKASVGPPSISIATSNAPTKLPVTQPNST